MTLRSRLEPQVFDILTMPYQESDVSKPTKAFATSILGESRCVMPKIYVALNLWLSRLLGMMYGSVLSLTVTCRRPDGMPRVANSIAIIPDGAKRVIKPNIIGCWTSAAYY